jgi:hypothetical protein
MTKKRIFKYYFLSTFGFVSLFCVLLPWMSYGIGSKTGIDIGKVALALILISGVLFLFFNFLHFKYTQTNRMFIYLSLGASFVMFGTYLFELVRIVYLTTIAKNLPFEMFGVASLTTAQIHIGYGLWLGLSSSLLLCLVNLIAVQLFPVDPKP